MFNINFKMSMNRIVDIHYHSVSSWHLRMFSCFFSTRNLLKTCIIIEPGIGFFLTKMEIINNIHNMSDMHRSILRKYVCFYSSVEIEDVQQLDHIDQVNVIANEEGSKTK